MKFSIDSTRFKLKLWRKSPVLTDAVLKVTKANTRFSKKLPIFSFIDCVSKKRKLIFDCFWDVRTISHKCIARSNFFLNFRNFGTKRDTTKKLNEIHRSLEDRTILFLFAFLTYISPFQSYGGATKLERAILWLLVQIKSYFWQLYGGV